MANEIVRTAHAHWTGDMQHGEGNVDTPNKALDNAYSFRSRFENAAGTNPEELLAASHAACFAMAFAGVASNRGMNIQSIDTNVKAHLAKAGDGYQVKNLEIELAADIPGADQMMLDEMISEAQRTCIISNALKAVPMTVRGQMERTRSR